MSTATELAIKLRSDFKRMDIGAKVMGYKMFNTETIAIDFVNVSGVNREKIIRLLELYGWDIVNKDRRMKAGVFTERA